MNRKEYLKKWREDNKEHIRHYKKEYAKTHDSSFKKLQDKYKQLQQENKQLKDNWNKLKEYIGIEWYCFDNESVEFEIAKDILYKMQEMEKNYGDVENNT